MHLAAAVPFPRILIMAALFAKRSVADRGGPQSPGGEPSAASATGYDRVGVTQEGEETRWLSRAEFQALALTERVRILAGGGARFYRGPMEVSPMEAMRGMP